MNHYTNPEDADPHQRAVGLTCTPGVFSVSSCHGNCNGKPLFSVYDELNGCTNHRGFSGLPITTSLLTSSESLNQQCVRNPY